MLTIIVDDEPLARRGIRARLDRLGGFSVVAECGNGGDAVAAIRAHDPELVFLDVQMPGLDGFAVVAEIGVEQMPPVIFVTAFDAHAVRAFEAHALDYLLKPIDDERFADAIARARRRHEERRQLELGRRLAALIADVGPLADETRDAEADRPEPPPSPPQPTTAGPPASRFVVRERDRVLLVDADDVDWLGADGDYVRLHVGGRSHLVRETMAAMEQRLDPARFVRIHRSAIVNIARIRELRPHTNREYAVILRDGTQLKLSRGYRDRLRAYLGDAL